MSNPAKTGEILFIKSVKDGIPNRDPLRDSDARRIFGEDDGRISLSDVSIKRDVRDYVLDRYPDGGDDKSMFVFVRKERVDGNKLLGREKLAESLLVKADRGKEADIQTALMKSAFDTRVFGAVFSVKKASFNQCGPVQFSWAHSLHPVETKYVQGTVVMPAKDIEVKESGGKRRCDARNDLDQLHLAVRRVCHAGNCQCKYRQANRHDSQRRGCLARIAVERHSAPPGSWTRDAATVVPD